MKTAGDILAADNQEVWTISPTATVYDALKLMSDKNIGALPVVVKAVIAEKNGCIDNLNEFSETLFMQNFDDHLAGGKG